MSLAPGDRLGPFDVVALVGQGGMGEVYRGRDAKLARDVAIKVLPDVFARDAERLARFRREAQALAALNDPHIAQIYHLEESGGRAALVMEFIDGRTLADLIQTRSLELDDALRYAGEIAAGLETAHEKGIVHRDLKPANVKITPEGHAKILDFGLAKAMGPGPESGPSQPEGPYAAGPLANSPTLTARATEAGVILGTAAYMSPEQARGRTIDKRTDIWAFGAVVFEMLSGRRAFEGETVSDTLASVLRSDPDWSALPAAVPAHVRALIGRCLERDVTRRLRDIGEARLALSGGAAPPTSTIQMTAASPGGPPPAVAARARPWAWMTATAVLLVALAALLPTSSLIRSAGIMLPAESLELAMTPPPGAEFQIGSNSGNVVLSPDGSRIAFVAATDKATTIWIRSLAADDARSLPGTENASNLFWSPDGGSLGFFAGGKLRTVKIAGGLPENIADAPAGRGGAWNEQGRIIFVPTGGTSISQVSATGGAVTALTSLDQSRGENAHYWPVFVPGGERFLFFARSTQVENSGLYLGHMDGSPPVRLISSLSSGIVARHPITGAWHLMWARDDELLAQSFDVGSGALSGDVTVVARGVRVEESQRLVYASASNNGHLAWAISRAADTTLSLYGRDGRRVRELEVPPGRLMQPQLSPDGTRLLFTRVERGGADVFMHDLRTHVTERLTTDPDYDELPLWTPDGDAFTYLGREQGVRAAYRQASTGGARPTKLQSGNDVRTPIQTPDRRYYIGVPTEPGSGHGLVAIPFGDPATPVVLLQSPEPLIPVALSSDGRVLLVGRLATRLAFGVARLRTDGTAPVLGPLQVIAEDTGGATMRPDGREVYIRTQDGLVKATAIAATADGVTIGGTTTLFPAPPGGLGLTAHPSGNQFVIAEAPFTAGQTIRVLTRWDARLPR